MDVFIEYLVKKRNSGVTGLLKVLIVLAAAALCFIFLVLSLAKSLAALSFIFLLLVAGVIYGAWWLFMLFRVEYEYIVTNGEMDVDRILGQRKRKRLITVNLKNIEIMAPVTGEHRREFENANAQKEIDASASPEDKDSYFIIVNHSKLGRVRLIFSPDERIIKIAQQSSPRKVFTA